MAEESAGATGEHRGELPRLCGESHVPDGVHAAVQSQQEPRPQSRLDTAWRQAEAAQLSSRDHAMLPGREPRDEVIDISTRGWATARAVRRL
jgi:hypothetical protein